MGWGLGGVFQMGASFLSGGHPMGESVLIGVLKIIVGWGQGAPHGPPPPPPPHYEKPC